MKFPHSLARWTLSHPKLIMTLAVLGLVAFGGWSAWVAFQPNYRWAERDADKFVIEDRVDRTSLVLAGMLAWGFLGTVVVRGKLGSMKWSGWDSNSFNARLRERLLRGAPIRNGVLLAYALFGLVGLGFSLALMGQALSLLPWMVSSAAKIPDHCYAAPLLAVFTAIPAARLLWQILIQAEWDYHVGDRRAEVAEEFLRAGEAERDEEREEARTSVGVWSWAVLVAGFAGGMLLSLRLPEAEQGLCILSALSGLMAAVIAVYVAGTKPHWSVAWLALVTLLFAAALVYGWHAIDRPTVRSLLLGVTGGATVGAMFTVLHLRKIRFNSPGPPS